MAEASSPSLFDPRLAGVVKTKIADASGEATIGSGYLVAPGLVLTARHVPWRDGEAANGDHAAAALRVRAATEPNAGKSFSVSQPILLGEVSDVDVAVLVVPGLGPVAGTAVVGARFTTSQPVPGCWMIGHPNAMGRREDGAVGAAAARSDRSARPPRRSGPGTGQDDHMFASRPTGKPGSTRGTEPAAGRSRASLRESSIAKPSRWSGGGSSPPTATSSKHTSKPPIPKQPRPNPPAVGWPGNGPTPRRSTRSKRYQACPKCLPTSPISNGTKFLLSLCLVFSLVDQPQIPVVSEYGNPTGDFTPMGEQS